MRARRAQAGLERRDIDGAAATVDDSGKIRGTAIVFDAWTTIGAGPMKFRERVAPGATTKTLAESDVIYLDNHDTSKPLARVSAGNLDIQVRDGAVHYLADPSDTSYARDLKANIRAKIVRGNSFGFEVVKDKWEIGADGVDERTLLEIKLPEISACTFPAYEQTDIGMREAYEAAMECRDRYYERANKEPYGDVTYADPGYQKDKKKRYPLDSSKHIHAAWSYINQAKNAAQYTSSQLAAIKAKIKAAAKKIGMKISQQNAADLDIDLRNYDPEVGFVTENEEREAQEAVETRDDPDGEEVAAMHAALQHLADGDVDAAREALETCLAGDETDAEDDKDDNAEDSSGMVAHTEQGGSAVPLRAAINEAYEAVRDLPPTSRTNAILAILEPHLRTPDDEQRGEDPKPDASTSENVVDEESLLDLRKRWLDTQHEYRSLSR